MGGLDLWLARSTAGETFFDSQVANLTKRRYPQSLHLTIGEFLSLLQPLRRRTKEIDCSNKSRIPFLVVFPGKAIPLEKQLDRIRFDDRRCVTKLKLADLVPDLDEELPALPYLALDVERGGLTKGLAAEESVQVFRSENRLALTVEEGAALLTHAPNVLRYHNIGCAGNSLNGCFVPGFGRCPVWGLILTVFGKERAKPDLGFASCGRRLRFGEALRA